MKRLLGAASAVLAVSISVPGGVAQAAPASTGTVKSIVFASQESGLWLVKGDGTDLHEIASTAPGSQGTPSFNPAGTQIAYDQGGEIWLVKTAGRAPRQLTHTGGKSAGAAWPPNGQWIAFSEKVGNSSYDVFRIRSTGGNTARVSYSAQYGCRSLQSAWSPDSTTIAYERLDDGNSTCASVGLVVQKLVHTGSVVVPGTTDHPSGNLVYRALCADVCGDQWVGYESAADGTQRHLVDQEDGCMAGDLCLDGMIGAPPGGRGWISNDQAYDENEPISDATTCFYGADQKNGAVAQTTPHFCLGGMLAQGFAAT